MLAKAREKITKIEESISSGQKPIFNGVVSSIKAPFGALIDIGDLEGFLHISQASFGHYESIEEILSFGQRVEVQVIDVQLQKR